MLQDHLFGCVPFPGHVADLPRRSGPVYHSRWTGYARTGRDVKPKVTLDFL